MTRKDERVRKNPVEGISTSDPQETKFKGASHDQSADRFMIQKVGCQCQVQHTDLTIVKMTLEAGIRKSHP